MVVASNSLLRLPSHLRRSVNYSAQRLVTRIMREGRLSTVCEEARCPNIHECFSMHTATFMIMGDRCTRRCHFCAVTTKKPLPLDNQEPSAIAKAAQLMGLSHVVVTSVDRDELPDHGASHFVKVVCEIKRCLPQAQIELLAPDFRGKLDLLERVLTSPIDIFGHNIESTPRLYKSLRPQSDFNITCAVLRYAALQANLVIKSGLMVGVGETDDEVFNTLDILRELGVHIVTIGQYLRPSLKHWPVDRYVSAESFLRFAEYGHRIGLRHVFSGPLVRSSYHAKSTHKKALLGQRADS